MKWNRADILWALQQPWDLLSALVVWWIAPFFRRSRLSSRYPWVIGGHRGRLRVDNAGDLHKFIQKNTKQEILWVANKSLYKSLRAQGIPVVQRNTWKARLAIMRSPILIYSHGEDDLDQYALLWRGILGYRVHLNHSMNFLKAGQWHRKDVDSMGWLRRKIFGFLMVDFDVLLACSELEMQNFALSFPHRKDRLDLNGGAHIDTVLARRETPPLRRILWFPTFRDKASEAELLSQVVKEVTTSEALYQWLDSTQTTLVICHHINSKQHHVDKSHPRIEWITPSELDPELAHCCAFISDYSGLLIDWLAMNRPTIFFPFDLDAYLRTRRLYVDYPNWHFGPLVQTSEALIDLLCNNTWEDQSAWQERRNHFASQVFPSLEQNYARRSYLRICELSSEKPLLKS